MRLPVPQIGTEAEKGSYSLAMRDRASSIRATGTVMIREPAVVTPDTDLYPLMEIILGRRQRLAPVVENNRLTGVVTRTDLVNVLVKEPARIPESLLPDRKKERNIAGVLRERLPKNLLTLLQKAGALGRDMGYAVYVVGGFVRDVLLKSPNADMYAKARDYARERGILIADTKFEFGLTDNGLILIDEVLTPDSSRFWPAEGYVPGKSQPSYDKQYLRDWLTSIGFSKQPPAPQLPEDVIAKTREKYLKAFEVLTGKKLA